MLEDDDAIFIRQLVDYSEILLPVEACNRYELFNDDETKKFYAYELEGASPASWLTRAFLGSLRPFTLRVLDQDNNTLLEVVSPFRFYFHRIGVTSPDTGFLGTVERRFDLLNKLFFVFDANNKLLCKLKGPLWKPWTFDIVQNDKTFGSIKKSWSGSLKEVFTDADCFGVEFPQGANETEKRLLLAAVFLIDFVYFEENPGKNYLPNIRI
ncbi:MAG: phospholipid scramblase family protein [Gammaproteobacteria bacterium]|nr:phospholipid scramblase family protein [Gammaproteobacteria bacterium]MDH5694133.1 phospholipid scramblase family protein [Gammaproteobacteria bacterium]